MHRRTCVLLLSAALAVVLFSYADPAAQSAPAVRSRPPAAYVPPRTPWGDPDLQGAYTNSDESLIPFERPDSLAGRTLDSITPAELATLIEQRNQDRIRADEVRWELRSPLHWFENHNPKNSRAWMVSDPPDGRVPPLTADGKRRNSERNAERAAARKGRGEADSYEDRSMYDRCISRGLPGSMMPAIYGSSYEVVQGPGSVGIAYEMVNELRTIPLDARPPVGSAIRAYMGISSGRFEGNTLVVEATNFSEKLPYRGSSDKLRLIERFTPTSPTTLEWSVTVDDSLTWVRPWTFAMTLTRTDERPFEYACHEGNYAMRNIMSIERAAEAARGR